MDEKYVYQATGHFEKKLQALRQNDRNAYERIMKVIDRLLENPADADGVMHGFYKGRLKKYVGKKDYRLIYYWCELCKKANKRLEAECEKCDSVPDRSVIFFDLYHKSDSKRLNR